MSKPQPRRRWAPGSTDEELMADLEAARAEDTRDSVLATAPESITSSQAAQLSRLFLDSAMSKPQPDTLAQLARELDDHGARLFRQAAEMDSDHAVPATVLAAESAAYRACAARLRSALGHRIPPEGSTPEPVPVNDNEEGPPS